MCVQENVQMENTEGVVDGFEISPPMFSRSDLHVVAVDESGKGNTVYYHCTHLCSLLETRYEALSLFTTGTIKKFESIGHRCSLRGNPQCSVSTVLHIHMESSMKVNNTSYLVAQPITPNFPSNVLLL